ncbi:MAG: DUF2231 domain-containing protein [Bacteroidota bacterium]|nr:DUF2231 domain-containing protein [Bacteroidota bacterium]
MVTTIHPMFIHFPIALIILAGILAIIDFSYQKKDLKEIILWNLITGSIGALIAVLTGIIDSNAINQSEAMHSIMEIHEKLGYSVLIISIILSVWFLWRRKIMQRKENLYFVLSLSGIMTIIVMTGYVGGKTVYNYGAGVKQSIEKNVK